MAKKPRSAYQVLHSISKENAISAGIESLIEWDQETYMPEKGIDLRIEQKKWIATTVHKMRTSKRFVKALSALVDLESGVIKAHDLSHPEQAAVREWRRDYIKVAKLPPSFVKTFASVTSKAIHVWAQAKQENAFKKFAPHLQKIVDLSRKKADLLGFTTHPYDALLDLFEPGNTVSLLDPLFRNLRSKLLPILQKAKTPEGTRPAPFLHAEYDPDEQMLFGKRLLKMMGFDETKSRLDLSHHPFCMALHPYDVRMTTKIQPKALVSHLTAVIHEGGHGLYHAGMPVEGFGSPLAEGASLGIDESQSRMWEVIVGHGLPFWENVFPQLQKQFPQQLSHVTLQEFYHAINVVKPSFIRIESDEVTYNLHIIIRYEIEKALIEGTLKVKDLPEAWNAKMQEYLGISPETDKMGCLQDIHWSMGAIGYFPTYTLGNLYAAQFFAAFEKAHPEWASAFKKGDFSLLKNWLHQHIHRYGRQYTPHELVMKATGHPLSENAFIAYLDNKYKR